jgi:predicted helicase
MNMNASVKARLERTNLFKFDRLAFKALLYKNIRKHVKKAEKLNLIPVIRLNGTSDLPWETIFPEMFSEFSNIIFYDYTKWPISKRNNLPSNYYLLRSHSEENHVNLDAMVQVGNVAVVFNTKKNENLPNKWNGFDVFDGDLDDLRFLDPSNVIVGLRAKGKAKKETATETGFVVAV